MKPVNRNMLWAAIIVDELARTGVDTAVIAPGSRSTPLALALADDSRIMTHSIIDERDAAFFALGYGLETGRPAVLLCSSGTATANFYPAIIEAHYANVPMIVLTADRPHELRDSGANQTVDQIRMYGPHVLWSVDVAPPESNPSEVLLRSLRTTVNRAFALACGQVAGPVHLNFPLRKPLEPIPVPLDNVTGLVSPRINGQAYTYISRGHLSASDEDVKAVAQLLSIAKRGLIIAGPRTPGGELPAAIEAFAQVSGFPVLADPLSNLRWSATAVIGAYDTFLTGTDFLEDIDLIIHIGALPASKVLEDFFARNTVPSVVLLTENGVWTDPFHRLTHLIQTDVTSFFLRLCDMLLTSSIDTAWAAQWHTTETAIWAHIETEEKVFFDGGVIGEVATMLPDKARLFVASSLSVRHLEQYGKPDATRGIRVFCNRGASGIDGTIASAFGVASAASSPTVLITGDLAFYHDMNALLSAKRNGLKLIIILLNNDGGGIFKRLPIADFEPQFTELFLTPHGLDFEPAAKLYGIDYRRVEGYTTLREAFQAALHNDISTIIEVRTDAESDAQSRTALTKRLLNSLKEGA